MMPLPALLELTVLPAGRQLVFDKGRSEAAHVFRRVGGSTGTWSRLAAHARSPCLDAEAFAAGTPLEYYVQFATRFGDEESRSPIVRFEEAVLQT
jgi:hypothetical protein